MRTLKTACADVQELEKGIIYVHYHPKIESIYTAREHLNELKKAFNEQLPLLILSDIRRLKKADKSVRDFFASEEVSTSCKARSVIVGSGISKLLGNWYIRFSKPLSPTKIFTNREKAIAWLQAQQQVETATE